MADGDHGTGRSPDTASRGPYATIADQCVVCHRSHTAPSVSLLNQAAPQSMLCFTCHDGTGAPDVRSQFTKPGIPANNPNTREYYGHAVLTVSTHVSGGINNEGYGEPG